MKTTTKIRTDLIRPSIPATVHAVQGDQSSRCLELSLYSNGVPWPIPDGAAIAMRYRKPDGTKGYYDTLPNNTPACSVTGNVISILLAPQMLTVAGFVEAQVELTQGTSVLGTFSVNVNVAANPAAGVLKSENYVNWLDWLVSELDAKVADLIESGDLTGPVGPQGPKGDPGSVSSVADISPDSSGNVPLTAGDVGALADTGGDVTGEIRMNGQPISGLNPPTEDTQAANKGYVDNLMTEGATYMIGQLKQAAPVNLLDNSDFRNPVNQRGNDQYNLDAWGGYTIDRWAAYASACTVTVADSGIKTKGAIHQPIDAQTAAKYNGKTVTVAAKIDGVTYCASGQVSLLGSYKVVAQVSTPYGYVMVTCENTNQIFFILDNASTTATVEWAALYEGEYTADTLPEYHLKGYGAELAECQRYYIHLGKLWRYAHNIIGFGIIAPVVCPVTMRLTPTAVGSVHRIFTQMGGKK